MYNSSVNISTLVLFTAICCKGNALNNPNDKLTRCCYYAASNNKRTPTPMETTIIMFFKLCIFIIAPFQFQSPMEAAEEPRGNAASLMGGLPKAANNWRQLSFPRLMSHQLFVFVYQQEIYPGKTRRPATWPLRAVRRTWQKAGDVSDAKKLRCYQFASLAENCGVHGRRADNTLSVCLCLCLFFFSGVHVMSICDTKINWKSGGEMIYRAAGRGWLIHSQEVISRISVMVAGDCWPSRLFLPGWQTTKHNGVFHCSWFIASETSSKATEAKTSLVTALNPDGRRAGCKSHSGHLKMGGRRGWD